jgi:hypothetical protein
MRAVKPCSRLPCDLADIINVAIEELIRADRLEPLLSATLPDPREDHIMERVDQPVGPLLMLEPVQRERFPGMPVSTHQPFDKHLRKVVARAHFAADGRDEARAGYPGKSAVLRALRFHADDVGSEIGRRRRRRQPRVRGLS